MVKRAPDWCHARCGVPLDQTLIDEGWVMHPSCEFPESAMRNGEDSNACSDRVVAQVKTGPAPLATVLVRALTATEERLMPHTISSPADVAAGGA